MQFNHSGKAFVPFLCILSLPCLLLAQATKETNQDLSKAAQKGMLTNTVINADGNLVLTYSMKLDKKSDQVAFEDYVFDKDLNFKGVQPGKEDKEARPDRKKTTLAAYAGGSNSFNVLSQKLVLQREEWTQTWNYKKQGYQWNKRLSKEKVNLKNNEGKYDGYTELNVDDGVFVIAAFKPAAKGAEDQFAAVFVDMDLDTKETPVTTEGNYSLAFYGVRENGNPFVLMAPNKKSPDIKQYVYAEFTPKADLVKRSMINMPSPNLMVMDYRDIDGSLYMVAGSVKDNEAFGEVFTDFANISNPATGISFKGQKYINAAYKKEMDNFHFLKLQDGALAFASTTPVKEFKSKVIAPPGQKKKTLYEGKRLYIDNLVVTPGGEVLMAGQLMDREVVKGDLATKYKDIIGLYFGSKGELKAQYAVEKINDDSKSEVFESSQRFFFTPDGKKAYWEIMEVKGTKGYASFMDAYAGNSMFIANYFPRIATIDLGTGALSEFKVMGDKGKFLMYQYHSFLTNTQKNERYYIGHDDDYKKLWLGKATLQ